MADFFQTRAIATLHRLGSPNAERLEADLCVLGEKNPMALILPCHVRELGTQALDRILHELKSVRYLRQIIVGVDGADTAAKWQRARRIFSVLPQDTLLLWNDGPRISRATRKIPFLQNDETKGKGRNIWLCLGAVTATGNANVVAMHDCDIANYSRELLARLLYPVVNSPLGFTFCKGYYARVSDRLHGRVTRLLVGPLLRAMQEVAGPHPVLEYLGAFRYPLAGEVALRMDCARELRVPHDWALEIGTLAESFRISAPRAVCQSDLCDNYDHKHQSLSPRDPSRGLHKVAREVALALLRTLHREGLQADAVMLRAIATSYQKFASEALRLYAADACINSLDYPREEEELAVATFIRALGEAAQSYSRDAGRSPVARSWTQMETEAPDFLPGLLASILADNKARPAK